LEKNELIVCQSFFLSANENATYLACQDERQNLILFFLPPVGKQVVDSDEIRFDECSHVALLIASVGATYKEDTLIRHNATQISFQRVYVLEYRNINGGIAKNLIIIMLKRNAATIPVISKASSMPKSTSVSRLGLLKLPGLLA
jgi:hypothetical protein